MGELRDTPYAREIRSASVDFRDGSQGRIELLYIKSSKQEEIRFSWWREGRMILRPLDLPEDALAHLMAEAVRQGVISPEFVDALRRLGDEE